MSSPNLFFSTPVWVSKINNYKETNEKIYNYIKNLHSADNKGIIKSNVKGWHSNNFNLEDENVIEFINLISHNINKIHSNCIDSPKYTFLKIHRFHINFHENRHLYAVNVSKKHIKILKNHVQKPTKKFVTRL